MNLALSSIPPPPPQILGSSGPHDLKPLKSNHLHKYLSFKLIIKFKRVKLSLLFLNYLYS